MVQTYLRPQQQRPVGRGVERCPRTRRQTRQSCREPLMKILYGARYARFDLLRATCHLACFITRWTSDCDKRLHRLICYMHSTRHLRMIGWVGDSLEHLSPHLYADADFAGCAQTQRSTSGLFEDRILRSLSQDRASGRLA